VLVVNLLLFLVLWLIDIQAWAWAGQIFIAARRGQNFSSSGHPDFKQTCLHGATG
jgi:hypothetical protein